MIDGWLAFLVLLAVLGGLTLWPLETGRVPPAES